MSKLIHAVGITIILASSLTGAAATAIREGKWSMSITTRMSGMDNQKAEAEAAMANMSAEEKAMVQQMMGGMGMQMGDGGMTITTEQCLTNDDPGPSANKNKDCKSTHTIDGNTVTFEETCPDSHSTGEFTYQNESMTGLIQSEGKGGPATIEVSGNYVGPCAE